MRLAEYKVTNNNKVDIFITATGDKIASLELHSMGNQQLDKKFVESVVDVTEKHIAYYNKPKCKVEIWNGNAMFSIIGTVADGNYTKVVIKATGAVVAVARPIGGNYLFDLSLVYGIAHATEVYIEDIRRYQKSLALASATKNRQQTVTKKVKK